MTMLLTQPLSLSDGAPMKDVRRCCASYMFCPPLLDPYRTYYHYHFLYNKQNFVQHSFCTTTIWPHTELSGDFRPGLVEGDHGLEPKLRGDRQGLHHPVLPGAPGVCLSFLSRAWTPPTLLACLMWCSQRPLPVDEFKGINSTRCLIIRRHDLSCKPCTTPSSPCSPSRGSRCRLGSPWAVTALEKGRFSLQDWSNMDHCFLAPGS